MATDASVFGGNPALRVPVLLEDGQPPLFGSENICRSFVQQSGVDRSLVILRGDLHDRLVANVEELTLDVMSCEVNLVFARLTKATPNPKTVASVDNSLRYLDDNVDAFLAKLPAKRRLSFAEVALFCLITHLPFREVLPSMTPYARLCAFRDSFDQRESARTTAYKFDAAP